MNYNLHMVDVHWREYGGNYPPFIGKITTGDPLMPQKVRNAKRIGYKISKLADPVVGEQEATAEDFFPVDETAAPPPEKAIETKSTINSLGEGDSEENSESVIITLTTGVLDTERPGS